MSIENEDLLSVASPGETNIKTHKKSKISYTREFLLSLSELEECKTLPSGFDESLLSEFDDASHGFQGRARVCGSSVLQGFRRSDYGSSPPTRGDTGNYSRGLNRWDSQPTGRSDTDSQSDKDSDSGRRFINQPRRSWQNQEHDGLLGSGSFPRPSGYGAGASVPRFCTNDHYQVNKGNESYNPPRPYKAVPHSRRETNDSYNDETFGSTECTSEDRVEEEKKRRAEFELMRKEQQKVLQEKLKLNSDKPKEDPLSEIAALMENPGDDEVPNKLDDHVIKPAMHNESGKLSSSQAPPSRPLVPPGFTNSTLERNSGNKSVIHPNTVQLGKLELEDGDQDEKELAKKMSFSKKQSETTSLSSVGDGRNADLSAVLEACQVKDMGGQSLEASNLSDASEVLGNGEIIGLDTETFGGHKIMGDSSCSTSILDKLFGSASTENSGATPNLIEDQDRRGHDVLIPRGFESSKFAHWFLEEGKKPLEDVPSEKSNDLLLLIVGGEKGGSKVPDAKSTQRIPPSESCLGTMTSDLTSAAVGTAEQLYKKSKLDSMPSVLTCEDLELSILSEISEHNSNSQPSEQGQHASDVEAEQPKADIDNRASLHLLSLLQKGMGPMNMIPISILDKESRDEQHNFEGGSTDATYGNVSDENSEKFNNLGKTLTLETLFGTAFMKELQSVDAPVSAQRNSIPARTDASESYGLSFPTSDDNLYRAAVDEIVSRRSHDGGTSASNGKQQIDLDTIEGHWLGFNVSKTEAELSRPPKEVGSNLGGFDGPTEVQLPEEDSLITVSDAVNAQSSIYRPDFDATNMESLSSSGNRPVDIAEKLAALGAAIKDERFVVGGQEGPPFLFGPYDMVKPDTTYQNLHGQSSLAQFHSQQMNHGRPLFHLFDSHPAHIDPQISFMAHEARIPHDASTHHQFSANMIRPPFPHHNAGLPEFDHPIHHPVLQQMHMPGNIPPHVPWGFPGGPSLPIHPSSHPAGYVEEHSPMQGFPFGQRQSNFGGIRLPMPGPELGHMNNPPEALQRLLEMELRSNPKQMHPVAPSSHTRPMYGHELDTGFWYR